MTFRDKLVKLKACKESLEWVKDKTIEEAWETCEDSEWMLWFLTKTDLDLTDPICDMADRVLHLVPEEGKLACSDAISAARRRANFDELKAAYAVAYSGTTASFAISYAARYAASRTIAKTDADDAIKIDAIAAAAITASEAAAIAAYAYAYASFGHDADTYACAKMKEEKKQCDILRKYFTIDQVREEFNKLVNQ